MKVVVGKYATQWWYRDGNLHRDGNKPAVIWSNGTQYWYRDGEMYHP